MVPRLEWRYVTDQDFDSAQNLTRRDAGLDLVETGIYLPVVFRRIEIRKRLLAESKIYLLGLPGFERDFLEGFQLMDRP